MFVRRITIHGQQYGAGLEAKRTAEAKVDRFRRSNCRLGHHQELTAIRLDTGETGFALGQRLTHVKGFL
jgi:hypothetical protein